jgi:hypothetical protein
MTDLYATELKRLGAVRIRPDRMIDGGSKLTEPV